MAPPLQILLGLTALICFAGGLNLIIKGAKHFAPKTIPYHRVLDNLIRFLSGIYFTCPFISLGCFYIHEIHDIIYFLGFPIAFSGLGRLYSRIKVGSAGKYFDFMMMFEILLGVSVVVLEYFR